MSVFVAVLRAVNVGGTAKLPMTELKAAGLRRVASYVPAPQ